MVTFKSLLDKTDFNLVWKEYLTFYPDMSHLMEAYLQIFNTLVNKETKENIEKMVIHIDREDYEEFDDEQECRLELNEKEIENVGYRVHGKNNSAEWNGYWDISPVAWDRWLGYYIHDKVIKFLRIEQVVALCLYEMTWHGLSESEVTSWANNTD